MAEATPGAYLELIGQLDEAINVLLAEDQVRHSAAAALLNPARGEAKPLELGFLLLGLNIAKEKANVEIEIPGLVVLHETAGLGSSPIKVEDFGTAFVKLTKIENPEFKQDFTAFKTAHPVPSLTQVTEFVATQRDQQVEGLPDMSVFAQQHGPPLPTHFQSLNDVRELMGALSARLQGQEGPRVTELRQLLERSQREPNREQVKEILDLDPSIWQQLGVQNVPRFNALESVFENPPDDRRTSEAYRRMIDDLIGEVRENAGHDGGHLIEQLHMLKERYNEGMFGELRSMANNFNIVVPEAGEIGRLLAENDDGDGTDTCKIDALKKLAGKRFECETNAELLKLKTEFKEGNKYVVYMNPYPEFKGTAAEWKPFDGEISQKHWLLFPFGSLVWDKISCDAGKGTVDMSDYGPFRRSEAGEAVAKLGVSCKLAEEWSTLCVVIVENVVLLVLAALGVLVYAFCSKKPDDADGNASSDDSSDSSSSDESEGKGKGSPTRNGPGNQGFGDQPER